MSLAEIIQQHLASDRLQLPVFHQTALKLQQLIARDDFDLNSCAALISKDQSLASQILREANSSFYSGLKSITTIKDAFMRLGAKEVLRITLHVTQQQQYVCRHPGLKLLMNKLWRHALGVAHASYWLAKKLGYQNLATEAFMAGLMHDIGELFLIKVLDELVVDKRVTNLNEQLVMEILETMHVEQGAWLMKKWGLPQIYADVAQFHHTHNSNDASTLLLLVQMADLACYSLGIALKPMSEVVLASTREAQQLDMRETTVAELEIMLEDKFLS